MCSWVLHKNKSCNFTEVIQSVAGFKYFLVFSLFFLDIYSPYSSTWYYIFCISILSIFALEFALLPQFESNIILYVLQHLEKMQLWQTATSTVTESERFYQLSSWKSPLLHYKCGTYFEFTALPLFFPLWYSETDSQCSLHLMFSITSINDLSHPHFPRTTNLKCVSLYLPTHCYSRVSMNVAVFWSWRCGHKRTGLPDNGWLQPIDFL